jgi:hypothetical protein
MAGARRTPGSARRGGFAMLTVLLVLLALLVLTTPFLMGARNASKASVQLADRAQARLALDADARLARAQLARSHPAVDPTPYADGEDELEVRARFASTFLDPLDPRGVMWDVAVGDVAGRIDLNSAPPQVFANMLGATTRLVEAVKADDGELGVASTHGFADLGFLWVEGELIGYARRAPSVFSGLQRGLAAGADAEGNALPCGPRPPSAHEPGAPLIDQRAFAPVLWRSLTPDGELRRFDAPERLRDSAKLALAGLDGEALDAFARYGTVYAGVRAGDEWQRPVRLLNSVRGGMDCLLDVDERRWFNPGATVQVSDGQTTEMGVVEAVQDRGVRLMQPLVNDYPATTAVVRVLARRPVNVNTASPEVLAVLMANLQLRGYNSRITRDEAEALAALIVESRPLEGFEDFLRRVVLPAAGIEALPPHAPVVPRALASGAGALIDREDALALYANALNANDSNLAWSTMPFAFTTRDVFDLELRAAVNAKSGVERVAALREAVEVIAPQGELLQLWSRQEDFDEALRLHLDSPWWASGPEATSRFDGGAVPPSRLWAHFGVFAGKPYLPGITKLPEGFSGDSPPISEHVFASREDEGWMQLWAARAAETPLTQGHMLHFDHETRDPEGRYLPMEIVQSPTADALVGWTTKSDSLLRAFSFSAWIKPAILADAVYMDVGQSSLDTDRAWLAIEGPDLVLRVFDGAGDHPLTPDIDAGEARFELAPGKGPGLAADTWSHVQVDVRGTRPDQITMLVDGRAFGVRVMGLSRLTGPVAPDSTLIPLESGEGFPDQGVVRIGDELIEYVKQGKDVLSAQRQETGAMAGFGGRLARMPFELSSTSGVEPGLNAALGSVNTSYAPGTPVMLYGYSLPLASNVPSAMSTLPQPLGRFAVGVVESVVGGSTSLGDPVVLAWPAVEVGAGLDGVSNATGLTLRPPDPAMTVPQVMAAFSPSGGYAAVIQRIPGLPLGATSWTTGTGTQIFGVEIIRYSGWQGSTLFIAPGGRAALSAGTSGQQPHAFVVDWGLWTINGVDPDQQLEWEVFVAPISIPAPGGGGVAGFPPPVSGSEFAQITHTGDAEHTEWVRYDQIVGTDLVRSDGNALQNLTIALTHGNGGTSEYTGPDPPGGGGTPASVQGPAGSSVAAFAAPVAPAAATGQGGVGGGSYWLPYMGQDDFDAVDYPVTHAARTAFQFRGVLGTYSHEHPAGTPILPVFRVVRTGIDAGVPGRLDAAFLFDAPVNDPGWPVRVHRAHVPLHYSTTTWVPSGNLLIPAAGTTSYAQEGGFELNALYVALQDPAPVPIAMGTVNPQQTSAAETRMIARLTLHPSGERPRTVGTAVVGGSIQGGLVPSATVDEIAFGSTTFGDGTSGGSAVQGAHLDLLQALGSGANGFTVAPKSVRVAAGDFSDGTNVLAKLPADAGLLRIGSEILAYDSYDADSGAITIAPGGRALLGTVEEPHEVGETAAFLEQVPVSVLLSNIGPDDSTLLLESLDDFPFMGTVIVDGELIHYTRQAGGGLDMPRASREPGKMDGKGAGLFRGRYGTARAAHAAGTPVILFPFRYWDRWSDRADAPELAYAGLSIDQPNAFWRSMTWEAEEPRFGGATLAVLQRVDRGPGELVPWDGDPQATPGLALYEHPTRADLPNAIAVQADRVEWRIFARYLPGAFDSLTGLSHGWKETPRLRRFAALYLAPNVTLRRVER